MNWEQRRKIEKLLKRAIKRLQAGSITPGDGVAIHYLRIARAAVRYNRTFEQQETL